MSSAASRKARDAREINVSGIFERAEGCVEGQPVRRPFMLCNSLGG